MRLHPSSLRFLPLLAALLAAPVAADQPAVQRQPRLTATLAAPARVTRVEATEITFAHAFAAPRHDHPCPVIGQVLEGTIHFQIEGQPAQVLHAGDTFLEPANTPIAHFDNPGPEPARFVAFYLAADASTPLVRPLR